MRCRHAAECVRGLPAVFDTAGGHGSSPTAPIPRTSCAWWHAARPARCERTRSRRPRHEQPVTPTEVTALPGGPVLVRGDLHVTGPGGLDERETRAALCSCGGTANAPYCDGSGTCARWPAMTVTARLGPHTRQPRRVRRDAAGRPRRLRTAGGPCRGEAVLRRAIELGVDHIDTAQYYGPDVVNELIRDALHPYPAGLRLVSKVGARRDGRGAVLPAQHPDELRADVEANLQTLRVGHSRSSTCG